MSILKFLKILKLKGSLSPLKSTSSYNEFKSYLANSDVNGDSLDLLFEWYSLYSVEQYCKDNPSPPSKLCCFGGHGRESIFISCEQCCTFLENYCICLTCFINSPHEHFENHKLVIYKSAGAICDCGNDSIMKSSGFCKNHTEDHYEEQQQQQQQLLANNNSNNNNSLTMALSSSSNSTIFTQNSSSNTQIYFNTPTTPPLPSKKPISPLLSSSQSLPSSPLSTSSSHPTKDSNQGIRLFFRHLMRYIGDIACHAEHNDVTFQKEKETIAKIDLIIQWIVSILTNSSVLLNVVSEEILGHIVDNSLTMDQHFTMDHPSLLPIVLDVNSPNKKSSKNKDKHGLGNSNVAEAHNNLERFFKHCYTIHYLYPLFIHMICSYKPFKYIFLRHFLPIYNDYYHKSFRKDSCNGVSILSVAYIGDDSLINYISIDKGLKQNLIDIICKQTIRMAIEVLPNVYGTKFQSDYWFRSDLYILKTVFKIPTVIKFILSEKGHYILDSIFTSACSLHSLKAIEFIPFYDTLGFVRELECNHMSLLTMLLEDPSAITIITKKFQEYLPTIKFGHESSLIKPHFPLYRMLSMTILHYVPNLLDQLDLSEEVYMEIAKTILLAYFHSVTFGLGHMRSRAMEQFADISTYLDLHLLQHIAIRLTPEKFFECFVESIDCLHPSIQTRVRMREIISVLISILQARPSSKPSHDEIRYHIANYLSCHDSLFLEMKALAFNFDGVPMETISSIYWDMVTKENKSKHVLKKEYWGLIDPYYFFHNQDTIKNRLENRYHLISKTAIQLPPTQLPRQNNPNLHNFIDIVNHSAMFKMILKAWVDHSNLKVHPSEDLIKNLFRNYNIVNEVCYIIALSLQMFREYTLPSLDLVANQAISSSISMYIRTKERVILDSTKNKHTMPAYCITSLLTCIEVTNDKNEILPVSLLDMLVDTWKRTISTIDQDLRPILQHIFLTLIEIDPQFKDYFTDSNVIIETPEEIQKKVDEQKKSVSDKRKKLLQQMRQQQMCFLQDAESTSSPYSISSGDSPVVSDEKKSNQLSPMILQTTVMSSPPSSTTTTNMKSPSPSLDDINNLCNDNNHIDNGNNETICIVCNQCSSNDEPLHVIGSIDQSGMYQHQKQDYERLLQDQSLTVEYRKGYKEVRGRLIQDIQTALQSSESADLIRSMLPMAFPYLFPTYVTSCHHYIHATCFNKLPRANTERFSCPLCTSPSNIIIPLVNFNHTKPSAVTTPFYNSLATSDFKSMKPSVSDKYVWKFIAQNIEYLELKSRAVSLYNEPNEDPYYVFSDLDFSKDLLTLHYLFNSIMSNTNQFTSSHDIQQASSKLLRSMDPFGSFSFMVYLLHHQSSSPDYINDQVKADLKIALESHYNQMILHYIHKEKQFTNIISTLGDIKRSPNMFSELFENTNNHLPFFRKLYLFTLLYNQWKEVFFLKTNHDNNNNTNQPKPINPFTLSLDQFSDINFLIRELGVISLQSYVETINLKEFEKHLEKQPVCYPFPLRQYDSIVKFITIPNKYFDYLKEMVYPLEYCQQCKQLITRACLLCGQKLCMSGGCTNARTHMKVCQTQTGLFLRFEDPGITILANSAKYYKIYRSSDGSSTSILDTSFVLYKKGLKKLYKTWLSNSNRAWALSDNH